MLCTLGRRTTMLWTRVPCALIAAAVIFGLTAGSQADDYPRDWGGGGQGYELRLDKNEKHGGKASGFIRSVDPPDANSFGTFTQAFRADDYRGKRVRMTAYAKSKDVEGWAGLWLRIDGKEKFGLAFDNMQDRAIKGTT